MAEMEVSYRPTGGIGNRSAGLAAIGEDKVYDAENWLFEDGVARNRPNIVTPGTIPLPSNVEDIITLYAVSPATSVDNVEQYRIMVLENDAIYADNPTVAALTGSALALEARKFRNHAIVNGALLIGANQGGLIRHIPGAAAYTLLTDAKYRYVTGHLSRAVAAYANAAAAFQGQTVAWSIAGDETNWTGAGSGSTILTEIPDYITGLATIRNVVVILRFQGITLGYPTGIGTSAFRFETMIREGDGCVYPSTLASDDNELFYVGLRDVYRFNLDSGQQGIGGNMRDEILYHATKQPFTGDSPPTIFYGFVTSGDNLASGSDILEDNFKPRRRYHLFPVAGPSSGVPHYTLDLESGAWARHSYAVPMTVAAASFDDKYALRLVPQVLFFGPSNGTSAQLYYWLQNGIPTNVAVADRPAMMTSRVMKVGSAARDYSLQRVALSLRVTPKAGVSDPAPPIKLTARARQKYTTVSASALLDVAELTNTEPTWQTMWVDLRLNGQYFQYILEVPHTLSVDLEEIVGHFMDFSESKSGMTS